MITYPVYNEPMLTLRGDGSDTAIEQDLARGDTASARVQYVSQHAFEAVRAKLNKGGDISRDDIGKLGSPERLPDETTLVPLDFGPAGGETFDEMLRKHGPRGTAQTYAAARDRAEAAQSGETITVKDFRSMATESGNTFKPLVMGWIILTSLCGILLSTTRDASRPFFLVTLPHLITEIFLWSYLLFGPEPGYSDRRRPLRLSLRFLYVAAALVVALGHYPDGVAGPTVLAVYFVMAGIAEGLSLWMGLFWYLYRLDVNMRQLGMAMFIHGFGFHIAALEYVCPKLFEQNGTEDLEHFGWVLFLAATCCGFVYLVPIFKARGLNIRAQQPSVLAVCLICLGTILSMGSLVALDVTKYHSNILRKPAFLPTGQLLLACKVFSSLGSIALVVYAVNEYTLAMPRASFPSFADIVGSSSPTSDSPWLKTTAEGSLSTTWCPGSPVEVPVQDDEAPADESTIVHA